jgi:hypothetical protein
MRTFSLILLVAVATTLGGCPSYKPYLPEQYRVKANEPEPTLGGVFTGRKGQYVIYGQ